MAAPTSSSGRPKRRSGMRRASSTMRGWAKNGVFTSVRKKPGRDRVGRDALLSELHRERAHQRLEPALRGDIGRVALERLRPHHRADEDEPPLPARRHVPRGHAGELVLRHQVGLDQTAEVVGRDVLEPPAVAHRGVVDEAIEPAVPRDDRVDGRRRGRQVGDVERRGERVRDARPRPRRRARRSRPLMPTAAPAAAMPRAISSPSPRVAPVTSATRPASENRSSPVSRHRVRLPVPVSRFGQ